MAWRTTHCDMGDPGGGWAESFCFLVVGRPDWISCTGCMYDRYRGVSDEVGRKYWRWVLGRMAIQWTKYDKRLRKLGSTRDELGNPGRGVPQLLLAGTKDIE